MVDWREILIEAVSDVESHFDKLKYRLHDVLGGPGPIKIVSYRGLGNRTRLFLQGRVLEDKGDLTSTDNDSIWRNLVNTYLRLESDEIPHARLRARFQDHEVTVQADEEGMFDVEIETSSPLADDRLWFTVDLELLGPHSRKQPGPVRTTGEVLVPTREARFVVISDIDDTVIDSSVGRLLHLARVVFLGNARTRVAFPGAAAFYRALHAGPDGRAVNPLFYVSNAPCNLYDLLAEFFQLHDIPVGPVIFLRNWGVSREELLPLSTHRFKLDTIRRILSFYPEMPFLLIGDSSQEDPEIYREIVKENPNRVMAVYIRSVNRARERLAALEALAAETQSAGSPMLIADDTVIMAQHAAQRGWISQERLAEIRAEKAEDETKSTGIEKMLEGPR